MKVQLAIGLWNIVICVGFMFGIAKILDNKDVPLWAKWLLGIGGLLLTGFLLIDVDD